MGRANPYHSNRLAFLVLLVAAIAIAGCSEDSTAPENKPPTIQLDIPQLATTQQALLTLTAAVSDPDEDPLTVNWRVLRDGEPSGTLTADDQGSTTMRWRAPVTVGRDSIIATVSDGKGGKATAVETILVGTLKTSSVSVTDTWDKANSPYVLRPAGLALAINERVVLTITEGVEVLIDKDGMDLSVVGRLVTNGTGAEPVVFRPNSRDPEPGDWQGITASPSSSVPRVELTNTEVLYAVDAVKANQTAAVELDGCRLMFARDHAVLHQSAGMLSVTNSAITNNERTGIRVAIGQGVPNPAIVTISQDSIAVNGDLSGGTAYDDDAGILIDLSGVGSTAIDISCNEISRNGVPGILLANTSYPDIHFNSIWGNERGKAGSRFNVRLADEFGGGASTVDARNNWWGAPYSDPADSVTIKQTIRDADDGDFTTVRVLIDPWLNVWPDDNCK